MAETGNRQTLPSPDAVHISDAAKKAFSQGEANDTKDVISEAGEMTPEIILVEKIVEMFTGRKVRIRVPDISGEDTNGQIPSLPAEGVQQPQRERAGWGLEYDASVKEYERESLNFEMSGVIKTTDGREINVSLTLTLDREFVRESSISVRAGDAMIDPLVINFAGTAAQLTDGTFAFDINADGAQESVHSLTPGSGYLVIDRNNDGVVNDGSELFGPGTGDGFAELREYDSDGNDWIDETDPAYRQIRVWDADSGGNMSLSTLSEKGVGAIHVGSVSAQFSLKDRANLLQGESKKVGIYLTENGTPGTIQELDLVV
jgi:hypothetical protein